MYNKEGWNNHDEKNIVVHDLGKCYTKKNKGARKMTVIAYSDILKSLSSPHGNVSLILEDMKKRKEEYEEELKYKKVDIVFFGYNVELPNSTPSYFKELFLKREITKDELLKEIEKEIGCLYVRKRDGSKLKGVEYYSVIKNFEKVTNPSLIAEKLILDGTYSAINNDFGLGIHMNKPDPMFSLSEYEIDLSK